MTDKKIEDLGFEEAALELEKIVGTLEQGGGELDKSIQNYERGIALKKHCEAKLKDAETKIEKITMNADGSVKTEPLDETPF